MMARRHLIIGGGTAGMNAIRTIREDEAERSEITLVSAEKPYSRMVLPYYLDRSISESHVFTATAAVLAQWGAKTLVGRRAASLDTKANVCTLDDGTRVEYDDCLIATGSSAVKAPVPGADLPGVHSFWTLDQCRALIADVAPGRHVVMVGAGFISFTILNSVLSLGAKLTIVEIAPRILPRMIDDTGAGLVEDWLTRHGVTIRTDARLSKIEDVKGKKRLKFAKGSDLVCDVVIMATGIRTNLEWLKGSGIRVNQGVVVDDHLRSNVGNVYAAGDVAEGPDRLSKSGVVHAIEPTAQEHGRVVGANMAGRAVGSVCSLVMNIGQDRREPRPRCSAAAPASCYAWIFRRRSAGLSRGGRPTCANTSAAPGSAPSSCTARRPGAAARATWRGTTRTIPWCSGAGRWPACRCGARAPSPS